jgi:hypothetical protein
MRKRTCALCVIIDRKRESCYENLAWGMADTPFAQLMARLTEDRGRFSQLMARMSSAHAAPECSQPGALTTPLPGDGPPRYSCQHNQPAAPSTTSHPTQQHTSLVARPPTTTDHHLRHPLERPSETAPLRSAVVPFGSRTPGRRGTWSRADGKGNRSTWKCHVSSYAASIHTGTILGTATCDSKCSHNCKERLTIATIKRTAVVTFGEAFLDIDWSGCVSNDEFAKVRNNHAAVKACFAAAFGCVRRSESDEVIEINYRLDGYEVCMPIWGHLVGMAPNTMKAIDRRIRAGESVWTTHTSRLHRKHQRQLQSGLTEVATQWWFERLQRYEMLPKKGLILYPRRILWQAVYADEFVPFVRLLGHKCVATHP